MVFTYVIDAGERSCDSFNRVNAMKASKISTAAFLAGATTLAVTLPAIGAEREFDLGEFDKVSVSAGLTAAVEIGDEFAVRAESPNDNMLKDLDIRVVGKTLYIGRDADWQGDSLFGGTKNMTVKITMPDVKEVAAYSGAEVTVFGVEGQEIDTTMVSGGDVQFN